MSFREPSPNRTLPVLWAGIVVAGVLIGIFVLTRGAGGDGGETGDAASSAPVTVDPSQLVPATDASLVAVVLEHVEVEPSYFKALYRDAGDYTKGTVGGEIWFGGTSDDADLIRLTAAPFATGSDSCEYYECLEVPTDAGTATLFWGTTVPGQEPGVVGVELARDGLLLRVHENGPTIEADPRTQELPVTVDDMLAIVTDPRFGIETTPEMVDAGEELDFPTD